MYNNTWQLEVLFVYFSPMQHLIKRKKGIMGGPYQKALKLVKN